MKRLVVTLVAAALLGCGGDEVKFDLENPPQWLENLDDMLPATPLKRSELSSSCLAAEFTQCDATVRASRSMTRKAKFSLVQGSEVRITYVPGGDANPVTVTLRANKPATVPVRRNGGTMLFRCMSFDGCAVKLQ